MGRRKKKRQAKDIVTRKTWTVWVDEAGRRVPAKTPGAAKETRQSETWYGWVAGALVPLEATSETRAREECIALRKEHREDASGEADPARKHRTRLLEDHLDDWQRSLEAGGAGRRHVTEVLACVRWILSRGKIHFPADLTPGAVLLALDQLQAGRMEPVDLPADKTHFRRSELAELLGISMAGVTAAVTRLGLTDQGEGNGKARKFPRAVAAALVDNRTRGRSSKTRAQYRAAIKQFARWLVRERRLAGDPLAGLREGTGKRAKVKKVHHARRAFVVEELQAILAAAKASTRTLAGLTGADRHALYFLAIITGWRAQELASLGHGAFRLDEEVPTVHLAADAAKNAQEDEQPLPREAAEALREYLATVPEGLPIWPGQWWKKAAAMFRVDLKAAGVPYRVSTPSGDLFGDFHSLRHSFIGLLDHAGATLRQAMQLARHSDPRLTLARYGRAGKKELAGTVERLPSLLAPVGAPVGFPVGTSGRKGEEVTPSESEEVREPSGEDSPEVPVLEGFESQREEESVSEENSPTRIRTLNLAVNSLSVHGSKDSPANDLRQDDSAPVGFPVDHAPEDVLSWPDADLAELVRAWDVLPHAIRRAVLTLVRAAQSGQADAPGGVRAG
jgi:integrase